jgi:hypothetical protein
MSRHSGHKSNQVLALDTPLSYDPDKEMIFGDESSNNELIFLKADGTSVRRQSATTGQTTRFNTVLGDVKIRIAKFAPETNLLCLQRNEREVEFLDLTHLMVASEEPEEAKSETKSPIGSFKQPNGVSEGGNTANSEPGVSTAQTGSKRGMRFVQPCATNPKVENKLLGFFWASATVFALVSRTMIEIFHFNPKMLSSDTSGVTSPGPKVPSGKPSNSQLNNPPSPLTKVREIPVSVNWWSFAAGPRVLLISTDQLGNRIAPFHFSPQNSEIVPLPKFKIEMKTMQRVSKSDVYLRQLYGQVFCIFINNISNEIVFYQLTTEQIVPYLTISNLPNGPIKLSFVDNIVLAHSLSLKVTAIYDIRFRSKSSILVDSPITPPLPVTRPLDVGLPSNTVTHSQDYVSLDATSPRHDTEAQNANQTDPPSSSSSSHSALNSPPKAHSTSAEIPITPKKEQNGDELPALAASHSFLSIHGPTSPSSSFNMNGAMALSPNGTSRGSVGHPAIIDMDRTFVYDYVAFLIPEYAVNRLNGQIYRLAFHFEGFVAAFRDPVRLVQLLMRRDRSKGILLKIVRKLIEQRSDMRLIAEVLDRFNGALQNWTDEQKLLQQRFSTSSPLRNASLPPSQANSRMSSSSSPGRVSSDGRNFSPRSTSPASSSGKRSSMDPWSFRRADQYVTAFKKSRTGSGSYVAGGNSTLGGSSSANGGTGTSTPSPGSASPTMSPSSSLGALPTPEEIGLDINVVGEPQVRTRRGLAVISQQDMYTQVFLPLEEKGVPWKILISVLMTYVTSLTQHAQLQVDSDIYGFIIDLLVRNKQYYQLHQLLQLRVISDTLHVACQLMHLAPTYPPATQLALDMFKRLKEHAYTIESLLSSGMVLMALKFLKSFSWSISEAQSLVPRFLHEAKASGDPTLFYITYTFFSQRKEIFTGLCDEYTRHFQAFESSTDLALPSDLQ